MDILVTGANGQLGSEIKRIASNGAAHNFTFVDIAEMDLGSDEAIIQYFQNKHFDFVINCAAYTAVDKAEEERTLAYRVNADAVKAIAEICREKGIRLIHISTDYVFDGRGNQPIASSTVPNPLSVYGKSKLAGEQHVLNTLSNAYIIRTAWVYSSFGKNFVKTIARFAKERETLSVVYDQIGSPTYARDLASAILTIIEKIGLGVDQPGIYHYTNEGVISWYDLAVFIVKHYNLPCKVLAIPSEEYKTLAVRPNFSVLDKRKLKETFSIEIPHWHASLLECLEELPA
ncbi:MAG: dTDP-4-dehydrorhamnose reductase [Chryseolinea sp.]